MTGAYCGHGCGQIKAHALKWCSRPADHAGCYIKMEHRQTQLAIGAQDYEDRGCPLPRSFDKYYLEGWNNTAEDRFNKVTHE